MRLLITGATGFIGKNFVNKFHKKYEMTAIVRPSSDLTEIADLCDTFSYNGDINHLSLLFENKKIDGILHFASMLLPDQKYSIDQVDSLIYSNIIFGTHLLEMTKKFNISFFINASTFAIYCNSKNYRPASLYAATKKAFEDIVTYYSLVTNTVFSHVVIFNTYGTNDSSPRLFNKLAQMINTNESLAMSHGEQIVDFSHVSDIAEAFDCLIQEVQSNPDFVKNKIFSLKGTERATLRKVVEIFEEIAGKKLPILWGEKRYRELEIMIPWDFGESIPSWSQKIPIKDGFKMIIDSIKK